MAKFYSVKNSLFCPKLYCLVADSGGVASCFIFEGTTLSKFQGLNDADKSFGAALLDGAVLVNSETELRLVHALKRWFEQVSGLPASSLSSEADPKANDHWSSKDKRI